jgi:hypothetical protein
MDQTAEWAWDRESGESAFCRELPRYIKERREKLKSNLGKAQILKDCESELLIQGRLYELEALQLVAREGRKAMARVIADRRIGIRENW